MHFRARGGVQPILRVNEVCWTSSVPTTQITVVILRAAFVPNHPIIIPEFVGHRLSACLMDERTQSLALAPSPRTQLCMSV